LTPLLQLQLHQQLLLLTQPLPLLLLQLLTLLLLPLRALLRLPRRLLTLLLAPLLLPQLSNINRLRPID
jgi:hypothetical protein